MGPKTEYEHRALYLYNFAKFTTWPKEAFADENAPLVVGILGQDPFGADLNIIKDKVIKNRKLVVKTFNTVEEIKECHLLFISPSEEERLSTVLSALEKRSILTVTEVKDEEAARGMINLVVLNDNRLGFDIDKAGAEAAQLKLDTQLLRLARKVRNHREGS